MIEIIDVSVEYDHKPVFANLSAAVSTGQFVGIVGPNGAGKTTLLRTINGLVTPTTGRVELQGETVGALSARELGKRVATVPQNTNLAFDFTVREIVELGRHPHRPRLTGTDPDPAAIQRALERTQTEHLADRPITAVSGGERQRVLLARALAQTTPVLLLDEPTASLDIHHQIRTLALVEELIQTDEITVLAAIHDLDLAARFCDELVLLADGKVQTSGPPESVLEEDTLEEAFGGSVIVETNPLTDSPSVTVLPG